MTIKEAIEQAIKEAEPGADHEVVFKLARGLVAENTDEHWLDELIPHGCEDEAVTFFKACFTGEPLNQPSMDHLIQQFRVEGARRTTERSKLN